MEKTLTAVNPSRTNFIVCHLFDGTVEAMEETLMQIDKYAYGFYEVNENQFLFKQATSKYYSSDLEQVKNVGNYLDTNWFLTEEQVFEYIETLGD